MSFWIETCAPRNASPPAAFSTSELLVLEDPTIVCLPRFADCRVLFGHTCIIARTVAHAVVHRRQEVLEIVWHLLNAAQFSRLLRMPFRGTRSVEHVMDDGWIVQVEEIEAEVLSQASGEKPGGEEGEGEGASRQTCSVRVTGFTQSPAAGRV